MKSLNRWNITATHEQMQGNAAVKEIASALHLRLPTAYLLYNRGCSTPAEAKAFLEKETEMKVNNLPKVRQLMAEFESAQW